MRLYRQLGISYNAAWRKYPLTDLFLNGALSCVYSVILKALYALLSSIECPTELEVGRVINLQLRRARWVNNCSAMETCVGEFF